MFPCYGSEKLNNSCQEKVEKEFSLCESCKKQYYGRNTETKRKWTIKEMQDKLKQWGEERKNQRLQEKFEREAELKNVRDTLF